jgi:hypothetical protein
VSRPPLNADDRHPDDLELARLAEPGFVASEAIAAHLAACPRCRATWGEFVEIRAESLDSAGGDAPADWVTRGSALATPAARRFAPRWLPLAAAATVVLVAGFLLADRSDLNGKRRLLSERMRQDSYGSLLYSEALEPRSRGVRGTVADPGADDALRALTGRYNQGKRGAADAWWVVAGYLSRNDLDNAEAYLRESFRTAPHDAHLLNLAAILAFKRNDVAGAARQLELALPASRDDAVRYNLAVVRLSQGDTVAARALARNLVEAEPKSVVGRLASDLLSGHASD